MPRNGGISFGNQLLLHGASAKPAAAIRRAAALLEDKVITILLLRLRPALAVQRWFRSAV
jgi:hypothetical protein